MKYLQLFIILSASIFLTGCVGKSSDVQANSDSSSKNSDNILKLTKLVDSFHKTDKTKALREAFRKDADAIFEQKIKSKNFVNADTLKKGAKVVSSISGAAGIPLGGPIMDTIFSVLAMFTGLKGASMIDQKRKKREYDLANAEPEEAHKIRKGRS